MLLVGPAAVEVRDDTAVDHDAHRRAELAAFGEVGTEGVAQRLEPRVAVACYRDHSLSQIETWAGSRAARTAAASTTSADPVSDQAARGFRAASRTLPITDHGRG